MTVWLIWKEENNQFPFLPQPDFPQPGNQYPKTGKQNRFRVLGSMIQKGAFARSFGKIQLINNIPTHW